jgi:hypothetical protein
LIFAILQTCPKIKTQISQKKKFFVTEINFDLLQTGTENNKDYNDG